MDGITPQKATTYRGGPLDGLKVEKHEWEYSTHCFGFGDRLAVYSQTDRGFEFERMYDADEFYKEIADVPMSDRHYQF